MPPRSAKGKKPKGRTSAYAYFVASRRVVCKQEGTHLDFSSFSKDCASRWRDIDEDGKKAYVEKALEDKARYDKEMSTYDSSAATKRRGGRRKKDPNAPKRPLSAFIFFCKEKRPLIMEENPKFSIGETAKELGKAWKVMTSKQKEPYEEKAQRDRKRYEDEKKDYVPQEDDEEEEEEEEEDDYED